MELLEILAALGKKHRVTVHQDMLYGQTAWFVTLEHGAQVHARTFEGAVREASIWL